VTVRVNAPPQMTMACHCRGCQKLSASAYSLTALFSTDVFEVLTGQTQVGALHGSSRYMYCSHCLNWLYTAPDAPFVAVRSSMFDVPAWSTPFVETGADARLTWVKTPAHRSFTGFPRPEDYGPLLQEYAIWSAEE
jgi:hypothetical protein